MGRRSGAARLTLITDVDFASVSNFIGFMGVILAAAGAAIVAGWRTAHWLLEQFRSLIESHQADLKADVSGVKDDVSEVKDTVSEALLAIKSVEVVQNQHAERLAWLEGQAGQPLGSLSRERGHIA